MHNPVDSLPRGIVPMQYAFFGADGTLDLGAFRLQIGACLLEAASAAVGWNAMLTLLSRRRLRPSPKPPG